MEPESIERISELCRETLDASWAEGTRGSDGTPFSYTRPSPTRYRWQWYWDSCFAAIVWRRFDRDRSRGELESLLRAGRDGFIGHVIFWDHKLTWKRRIYYNVKSRSDEMTGTIQPPLLAWAWKIAVGDPREVPAIAEHHSWLTANRDLEGDGLIWLVQPDESGLDSSPKFDPVWGWKAHAHNGFPLLVRQNARVDWDARRVRDAGRPVLCETVTNVLWGLSRIAMGEDSITGALVDRLWSEEHGMFLDQAINPARSDGERPLVNTWAALAPLALPDLPEQIGRRMIEEHLLNPDEYWLSVPPPSVAATEPSYEPGRGSQIKRRYWRGPTWINSAWMLWLGMKRLGYDAEADQMVERLSEVVLRERLREYYDPRDGSGLGATEFAWSSLIIEMADPAADSMASYL